MERCRGTFIDPFQFEKFSIEHFTTNNFQNVTNVNLRSLAVIFELRLKIPTAWRLIFYHMELNLIKSSSLSSPRLDQKVRTTRSRRRSVTWPQPRCLKKIDSEIHQKWPIFIYYPANGCPNVAHLKILVSTSKNLSKFKNNKPEKSEFFRIFYLLSSAQQTPGFVWAWVLVRPQRLIQHCLL